MLNLLHDTTIVPTKTTVGRFLPLHRRVRATRPSDSVPNRLTCSGDLFWRSVANYPWRGVFSLNQNETRKLKTPQRNRGITRSRLEWPPYTVDLI